MSRFVCIYLQFGHTMINIFVSNLNKQMSDVVENILMVTLSPELPVLEKDLKAEVMHS